MEVKKIIDAERLYQKLDALRRKSERLDNGDVVVGFSASYAIYVHENLQAKHTKGEAKFLEKPARAFHREAHKILAHGTTRAVAGLLGELLIAGRRIQGEAQELCPVDTGNLKASAFTERV